MSNTPAACRTATCSSMMLVYCTGISQPPNSISFPPSFWCALNSGVRFMLRSMSRSALGRWPSSCPRPLHPEHSGDCRHCKAGAFPGPGLVAAPRQCAAIISISSWSLSKLRGLTSFEAMLRKWLLAFAPVCFAAQLSKSDTIQLKDQAEVVGKILAEKRDQVAVDIGYTVLVIPRNQILKGSRTDPAEPGPKPLALKKRATETDPRTEATFAETTAGFYSVSNRPLPSRTVRELVNQLGEAVVQVRTPSGLGSGFILNADGFLMTNFHVIEGETQISVEVYHQAGGELERKSYKQVRIIAINKFADLALLKIDDKNAPKFKYVLLGSADA